MQNENSPQKPWVKSATNLYRYTPTGGYYARARIGGKLKIRSLDTDKVTVARLRLTDYLREERQRVDSLRNVAKGKMTIGEAVQVFKERLESDKSLKPRSKEYRLERLNALRVSWPNFEQQDIARVCKQDCAEWSRQFGKKASATAFNNTVGTLRMILDIGVEFGARYDNPAKLIDKHRVRPKKLELPSQAQFQALVSEIESVAVGTTKRCANLVRFLAYGGFRKSEAAQITWGDCDFEKGRIRVQGDAETGTKNWSERRVPMIPDMRELLEKLRADRPDAKPADRVMLVSECQGALTRACKTLNIARITHHDLRHLFATRCIESGVDIPTVAKWLGHQDGGALAMKVYGHLREEHSVSMAKKVTFQLSAKPQEDNEKPSGGESLEEGVNVATRDEDTPKLRATAQMSTFDLSSN